MLRRLLADHKADWPQVIWVGLDMAHAQKATVAAPSSEGLKAGTAVALMQSTDAVADVVGLWQKKPADASDHETTAVVDTAGQARAAADGAAVPAHNTVARADASDAEQTTKAVSVGALFVCETSAGAADQARPKFSLSAATVQAHGGTTPPTAVTDAASIKSLLPHAATSAAPLASAPTERTSPTAFPDTCIALCGIRLLPVWRSGARSGGGTGGQEAHEEPQAGDAYTRRAVARRLMGQPSGPG